jgi:hypothetical protein
MLGYRNSYGRTVAAALLASSLAVMAAIAFLITPSAVFPLRLATELLSLVCLAIAVRKRPVTILVRDQRYGQRPLNGERWVVKSYTTCSAWGTCRAWGVVR